MRDGRAHPTLPKRGKASVNCSSCYRRPNLPDLIQERVTENKPPVEIAVLGPLVVRVGGVTQPIQSPKQRMLLVRLTLDAGHVVSSDQLVDALWGEAPPPTAAKNLQVLVGRLRAVLGATSLVTDPSGYRLDPLSCSIDAMTFEQLVGKAEQLASEPDGSGVAIVLLTDALVLWRGEVAPELDQSWGAPRAARWTELRRIAHERLLALRMAANPSPQVIDEIRALIALRPDRESLRVLLIDALRRSGDMSGARRALDDAVDTLDSEFGLAPGSHLTVVALELGVSVDRASLEVTRDTSAIVDAIATCGARFRVVDALAVVAEDVADADVLDELEAMVDRGQLSRSVDEHGRVLLTKVSPRGTTT